MRQVDLANSSLTLAELLALAGEDDLVLRTPDGRRFVLVESDGLAEEITRALQNEGLMRLLEQRSRERGMIPLGEVREQLDPD